jgi:hypothetical protein
LVDDAQGSTGDFDCGQFERSTRVPALSFRYCSSMRGRRGDAYVLHFRMIQIQRSGAVSQGLEEVAAHDAATAGELRGASFSIASNDGFASIAALLEPIFDGPPSTLRGLAGSRDH